MKIQRSEPSIGSRAALPKSFIALSLLAFALCGCIINTGSHSEQSGRYIGQQTFDQVTPGKSKAFVLAVFGEPTTKTPIPDGTEIWKWRYRETKKSSGSVLFVFNGDNTTETDTATYVVLKDDIVTQAWRD